MLIIVREQGLKLYTDASVLGFALRVDHFDIVKGDSPRLYQQTILKLATPAQKCKKYVSYCATVLIGRNMGLACLSVRLCVLNGLISNTKNHKT